MFEKVKEQHEAKNLLSNAIKNSRINHCYIFAGPEGTGRFSLAENFLQTLVCKNNSSCDTCSSCRQFLEKTTPDYKITDLLFSNGKEKTMITVDQIRDIVSDIYIKPSVFDRKLYIIKNADKMNVNAQNALLKVLEEPPKYTIFVLIVKSTDSLLPTILSRGTVVSFVPLSDKTVKEILKEKYNTVIPPSLLCLSGGSVKDAYNLSVSEEHKGIRLDIANSFIDFLKEKNEKTQLLLYKNVIKYEKEKIFVLNVMNSVVSDLSKKTQNSNPVNTDFSFEKIQINNNAIYDIFSILSELVMKLSSNINYNLAVFAALDKIRKILSEYKIRNY